MGCEGRLALTANSSIFAPTGGFGAVVDELAAAQRAQGRQGDVLIDAQGRDEPEPFTVLGHHTDAGRERILRRPDHQRPTFEVDDTARSGLESVDGADHFGASGAHQAGKGDHFAAADLETDVSVGRFTGQSGDLEKDFIRRKVPWREDVGHLSADHE
jgi:hypothetical protein